MRRRGRGLGGHCPFAVRRWVTEEPGLLTPAIAGAPRSTRPPAAIRACALCLCLPPALGGCWARHPPRDTSGGVEFPPNSPSPVRSQLTNFSVAVAVRGLGEWQVRAAWEGPRSSKASPRPGKAHSEPRALCKARPGVGPDSASFSMSPALMAPPVLWVLGGCWGYDDV